MKKVFGSIFENDPQLSFLHDKIHNNEVEVSIRNAQLYDERIVIDTSNNDYVIDALINNIAERTNRLVKSADVWGSWLGIDLTVRLSMNERDNEKQLRVLNLSENWCINEKTNLNIQLTDKLIDKDTDQYVAIFTLFILKHK